MLLDRLVSGFESRANSIPGPFVGDAGLADFFGYGPKTGAGIAVTETTALKFSAVWDCVNVLSSAIATLPFNIFEEDEDGSLEKRSDHYLFNLLHSRPNPEMTSFRWRVACEAQRKLWGNAYNFIERRGGKPVAVWNHVPNMVEMDRVKADNRLVYVFREERGGSKTYEVRDVLHLRGLSLNGIQGLSVIKCAREAVGLGLAGERFGSTFFGNGLRSTVALRHPGKLGEQAVKRLKEAIFQATNGVENWNLPIVLQEGMGIEKLGMSPEDSQYLELREHQVEDVYRWFGVPRSMANLANSEPRANAEQDALNFAKKTMLPAVETWETECDETLVAENERGRIRTKLNYDALLRGDMESRFRSYATGRQWGILSANECRRRESLNPIYEGDIYLTAVNMQDASKPPEKPPEEPPAPKKKPARSVDWVAVYEPMFVDAVTRLVAKERKYFDDQIAKRGEPALSSENREKFYADHARAVRVALEPVFRSLSGAENSEFAGVFAVAYAVEALETTHPTWVNDGAMKFARAQCGLAVKLYKGDSHEPNE